MAFHPYLFFGRNCAEAFTRYQEIFGGELSMMTMGDTPSDEEVPPEQADLMIHAALDARGRHAADGFRRPDHRPLRSGAGDDGQLLGYRMSRPARRVFEALARVGR